MNILVIEDERTDFILIKHAIEQLGDSYRVIHAQGCQEAVHVMETSPVGLALVDIMLPDGDGFKVSEQLKAHHVPYVMVSSKSLPENAVRSLRSGAEDYIRKPFDIEELAARLERVLLRTRQDAPPSAPAPFEEDEGAILVGDVRIALTPIEQQMLHLLRRRFDTYVSSEELIKTVWGPTGMETSKGALRTYISHIRKKLSHAKSSLAIESKWGRGYKLTETLEAGA